MMGTYRMPDGTHTEDKLAYLDAWALLGAKLEPLFPGYHVDAFDPGIRLSCNNYTHTFTLPKAAALALLSAVESKQ